MSFEVESKSETQATIRIRVDKEAFEQAFQSEIGGLQQRARVPGFRPGKVPRQLLARRIGDSVTKDLRRRLFSEAFQKGIGDHKLHPVEPPLVKDEDLVPGADGAMKVEFAVELIPHLDPSGYDRFTVTPPAFELKDEDLAREIEGLRRQAATASEVKDGEAAAGDVVIADLSLSFDDGSSFPNKLEGRIIDTGAALCDGVPCEDAKTKFVGVKRGDAIRVTMRLPDEFPLEAHRGKSAITDCVVKDIRRVALPDVESAEFHARVGVKDSADLRAKMRERMQATLKAQQDRAVEELCVDQLLERHRIALPEAFVQRNVEAERERVRRELVNRGAPPADVEKQILESESRIRSDVERRLREAFLLDRIAEQLATDVSVQELEQQFTLMARAWQVDAQKLFDHFQSQGLLQRVVEDIRRAKVRRQLRANAAASENDGQKTS